MSGELELDRNALRAHTPARVALRRAGTSLATAEILDLNLCLAEARDAIHARLSAASMLAPLQERGWTPLTVRSAARDRGEYLRRPDLGRRLDAASREILEEHGGEASLAVVIADGLSAIAPERHAIPVLDALAGAGVDLRGAPVVLVEQGRVAIGDEIGELLKAELVLLLIGERPGLSSPDSLGAYLTWGPRVGRTDAERNCISNIRPEGLGYGAAAETIAYYLRGAREGRLTGVALKGGSAVLPGN